MRRNIKFITTGLLLSILLTVMTLVHETVSQRYIVDPDYPPYRTEFVDAWGWPLGFVVDDPRESHVGEIGFEDKFLFAAFLSDWLFFVAIVFGIVIVGLCLHRSRYWKHRN